MKVRSTLYYGETPINECDWELDDRARTTQQALAAITIEDHLRESLRVEHKIIAEEVESETEDATEDKVDIETSESSDQPVQSEEDSEYYGVDRWANVDED